MGTPAVPGIVAWFGSGVYHTIMWFVYWAVLALPHARVTVTTSRLHAAGMQGMYVLVCLVTLSEIVMTATEALSGRRLARGWHRAAAPLLLFVAILKEDPGLLAHVWAHLGLVAVGYWLWTKLAVQLRRDYKYTYTAALVAWMGRFQVVYFAYSALETGIVQLLAGKK
jgi:hypothetical protein